MDLSQGLTSTDTVALLATTTGIAGIVWAIMAAIRTAVASASFDRWAPIVAIAIGIVLAELYAFATVSPLTGTALVGALVSGILGGALSQNVNTAIRRMIAPPGS